MCMNIVTNRWRMLQHTGTIETEKRCVCMCVCVCVGGMPEVALHILDEPSHLKSWATVTSHSPHWYMSVPAIGEWQSNLPALLDLHISPPPHWGYTLTRNCWKHSGIAGGCNLLKGELPVDGRSEFHSTFHGLWSFSSCLRPLLRSGASCRVPVTRTATTMVVP
jgi:hypothetical protein